MEAVGASAARGGRRPLRSRRVRPGRNVLVLAG